jgi:predicted nucleotidyltransferase
MRILNRLQKDNAVDFKKEGKNNKYFLKDSLEARSYLLIAEEYKLMKSAQIPALRSIIRKIIEETDNEMVILFGSYAKGNYTEESDIDLYIETDSKKLREKLQYISEKLSIKIGKFDLESSLAKEIIKNHVLIKNKERFYRLVK